MLPLPQPFAAAVAVETGATAPRPGADELAVAAIGRGLASADAAQRAEAALALGTWGGPGAARRLQAMLDDPSPGAVVAATIGLGLLGSARGRWALQRQTIAAPEPWLRGVAMVGLGLDHAAGATGSGEGAVVAAWETAEPAAAVALGLGACAFDLLAPTVGLFDSLHRCVADPAADRDLRTLAASALAVHGGAAFGSLLSLGCARNQELRLAGLCAIANCQDPAGLATLEQALRLAHGPDEREWLVLQLALRPEASALLLRLVEDGHKPLRGTAALALAFACRGRSDPAAQAAVLLGCQHEASRERLAPWYLAAGLLGVHAARAQLTAALVGGSGEGARGAAAEALVLLDLRSAVAVLQARLPCETDAGMRVLLADLMARSGAPLESITAAAEAASTPDECSAITAAVGWLRTAPAVQWLAQRAVGDGPQATAALHGLSRARRHASLQLLAGRGRHASLAGWLRQLVLWYE